MIKMTVNGVTATATEKEVLTAGRVGLRCAFEFAGGDWGGLFKTAVFQGIETVDVALTDNECVVPWEAMAVEGVQLKVGVYGANGNGDIVIPTVWANFGKIQPSAVPSGVDPQTPSQNANAYAVETAEQALAIAQGVETRANNGEFDGADGFSPSASVSKFSGIATITITDKDGTTTAMVSDGRRGADGSSMWTTATEPSVSILEPVTYAFSIADLEGGFGTPQIGDIILYGSAYYNISAIDGNVAECSRRTSIKGDTGGVTEEVKQALLQICQKVAYIDEHGQDYYQTLYNAFYSTTWSVTNTLSHCITSNAAAGVEKGDPYTATITPESGYKLDGAVVTITMGGLNITQAAYSNGAISIPAVTGDLVISIVAAEVQVLSISAVFTQGSAVIYDTDSLDTLKQYLVVTANYSDSTTATVTDYTLSGTLTEGTSTITVSYGGKTDTFTVIVSVQGLPSGYEEVEYIFNPNGSASGPIVDTGIKLSGTGDAVIEASFMAYGSESTPYVIGCLSSTSTNTIGLGISLQDSYTSIIVFPGTVVGINPQTVKGVKHNITATVTSNGASITDGTLSNSGTFTPRVHNVANIYLFGIKKATMNEVNYPFTGRIYSVKVTENNVVKMNLVPCVRLSDGMAGFWDIVNSNFIYHSDLVAAPSEHNTTAEIEFPLNVMKWVNGAPVRTASSANNGTTKKYSIDATTSLYPAGILPYKYHSGSTGNLNEDGNIVIYDAGGNAINHVNVSASPARWAQTSNYTEYSKEWTVSAYTGITFDVSMEYLHDSYMYDKTTGQVFFAGRNTPYYGMSNISEAGGS